MLKVLQRALDNVIIARQAIDVLNKMDIEQTRMRYCFTEYKEVYAHYSSLTTGREKLNEIMYRN